MLRAWPPPKKVPKTAQLMELPVCLRPSKREDTAMALPHGAYRLGVGTNKSPVIISFRNTAVSYHTAHGAISSLLG